MDELLNDIIKQNRKTITLVNELLSDCPDRHEAKMLDKAMRELKQAMEFIVSAKMYQSDKLENRSNS